MSEDNKVHTVQNVDIFYDAEKNQFFAEVNGKEIRSCKRNVVEKKVALLTNKGIAVIYDTSYHNGEYPQRVDFLYWTRNHKAVIRDNDGEIRTLSKYDTVKCYDEKLYKKIVELNKKIGLLITQRQQAWKSLPQYHEKVKK